MYLPTADEFSSVFPDFANLCSNVWRASSVSVLMDKNVLRLLIAVPAKRIANLSCDSSFLCSI